MIAGHAEVMDVRAMKAARDMVAVHATRVDPAPMVRAPMVAATTRAGRRNQFAAHRMSPTHCPKGRSSTNSSWKRLISRSTLRPKMAKTRPAKAPHRPASPNASVAAGDAAADAAEGVKAMPSRHAKAQSLLMTIRRLMKLVRYQAKALTRRSIDWMSSTLC